MHPFPPFKAKLAVDLTQDWLYQAVDPAQKDVTPLLDSKCDDHAWEKIPLGIFTLPNHPDVRHFIVRKHFHVPDSWNHGRTLIRLPEVHDSWKNYLDGVPYNAWNSPDPVLDLGSDHVLAVDCICQGPFGGTEDSAWLAYHPDPVSRQDLSGKWGLSTDSLKWTSNIALPGDIAPGPQNLRASFRLDPTAAGKTVVVHVMERSRQILGLVINGHYVAPSFREGSELNLNITPWIKADQDNELVLIKGGGGGETVTDVALEFHISGTYP